MESEFVGEMFEDERQADEDYCQLRSNVRAWCEAMSSLYQRCSS